MHGLITHIETGGLSAAKHPVIEIGLLICVATPGDPYREVGAFNLQVKPAPGLQVEHEAAQLNGYTESAWLDALLPSEVQAQVEGFLASLPLGLDVGFSPQFRDRFLKVQMPWFGALLVGTQQVNVGQLLKASGVQGARARDLRTPEDGDTCVGICRATLRTWNSLAALPAPH